MHPDTAMAKVRDHGCWIIFRRRRCSEGRELGADQLPDRVWTEDAVAD
jgi:hypothetical protein